MLLCNISQADTPAAYFVVAGGLLLAGLALFATKDGFRELFEWPSAFMVGAIHVDLLAFRETIFQRYSFGTTSEFLGFLLAFHGVVLLAAINVRNL